MLAAEVLSLLEVGVGDALSLELAETELVVWEDTVRVPVPMVVGCPGGAAAVEVV